MYYIEEQWSGIDENKLAWVVGSDSAGYITSFKTYEEALDYSYKLASLLSENTKITEYL